MVTGSLPIGLTAPNSTRAAAYIDGLVHEYVVTFVCTRVSDAMSYGLRAATRTTGLPVSISALTRLRCEADPDAFDVTTTTRSLAFALATASEMVAELGAVPVSNTSGVTPCSPSAAPRCATGVA